MKQLTLNGKKILFVPIPDDADNFSMVHGGHSLAWTMPRYKRVPIYIGGKKQLIATTTDITEGQAASMVEGDGNGYFVYGGEVNYFAYKTALISFASFLRANNITGRHAIIELL